MSTTNTNLIKEALRPRVDAVVRDTIINIGSQMYTLGELDSLKDLGLSDTEREKFIASELIRRLKLCYDLK